jgi:hypothetical protein
VGRPGDTAKLRREAVLPPEFVVPKAVRRDHPPRAVHESLASASKQEKGINTVEFSGQAQERIRQEEVIRLQLREEIKRKKRPALILLTVLWALVLSLLAFVSPHFHH